MRVLAFYGAVDCIAQESVKSRVHFRLAAHGLCAKMLLRMIL